MGRKRKTVWRSRIIAVLALAVILAGAYGWWRAYGWQPPRETYQVQGALIGEADGQVDFNALGATGADFVYLEASRGATGRDGNFARNLAAVEDSGIPHGVVHAYDPCIPAERQAANFVTMVPREASLLPAAVALEIDATTCGDPIVEAAVESELTTFINQVESHTGQPVVLKVSRAFESRYGIANRIERNLWLTSGWREPDYAGRPWTLWTANEHYRAATGEAAMRWVVVQP